MLLIPASRSAIRLLEVFDDPAVPARYTFIFDAINQDVLYVALELSEDGYELSRWTAEPVQPPDDQRIACPQVMHGFLQAWALGLGAAGRISEDSLAICVLQLQRVGLEVERLVLGGDAGVAN